jgi:hypothetical protein
MMVHLHVMHQCGAKGLATPPHAPFPTKVAVVQGLSNGFSPAAQYWPGLPFILPFNIFAVHDLISLYFA